MKRNALVFFCLVVAGQGMASDSIIPKKAVLTKLQITPVRQKVVRIVAITETESIEADTPNGAFDYGTTPIVIENINKTFTSAWHLGAWVMDTYCDKPVPGTAKRNFMFTNSTACVTAAPEGKAVYPGTIALFYDLEGYGPYSESLDCN